MQKVAIYCRVSTALQEQEKTIDSQLAELKEICKDFQIIKEYVDDGFSGELLDRPSLDALRSDAKEGLFEALYIHSADRLSRNLYHQGIVVEELKKKGIEIFIGDKSIANTPEGRFMFNVLGAAAEFEKEKILERTRRGRIYKAKQKGIIGAVPSFGYGYTKKTPEKEGYFTLDRRERKIVNLIFDLYIEFQSLTRVQKELALRTIKPRKNGEKWCRSTLKTLLRNETYIGTGYYNKYRSVEIENGKKYRKKVKAGRKLRERNEWIPLKFPAIVDEDKFRLVQSILSKKYKPFGQSKYFYLLSGLMRCTCGSTFTGAESGGNFYYRCSNRRKRLPLPKECNAAIRTDKLDSTVWAAVGEATMNPKTLTAHVAFLANKITDSESILKEGRENLLREKKSLTQKKNRLLEIYTDGSIDKEQFLDKMEDYNQREEELRKEIREIGIKSTQVINKPLIIKNIQRFCNLARSKLPTLNLQQRQQFLRYLLDEIVLDSKKRKASIIGYVPVGVQDFNQCFTKISFPQVQIGALYMPSKVFANRLRMGKLPS